MFGMTRQVDPRVALKGRDESVLGTCVHEIYGTDVREVPQGSQVAYFALGCFWGAEKEYWERTGVTSTAVGYMGGFTPNPTYEEVCSGRTGHAETVRVCFDPERISYADLVRVFFEVHDPTQGMRQGNDIGTQYRSAIYTTDDEQAETVQRVRDEFQQAFSEAGYGEITTEVAPAGEFYFAECYHQQYLNKNPGGYCPNHSTGVRVREGWQSEPTRVHDLLDEDKFRDS
ncbi:peptide-methionine (S)-S-oxide reductase MsrA [Nigerium massiliense]|uniref:peptide-methionine (S)-S-oxide reductase MsrA n=1 Tax=Nigerium massiliense TaxID=1522317 RepID=UPI0009E2545B|nr:peptide-methionine (S)-S-oxide reductase MsrA [Nigerium massiliense]